MNLSTNSSLNVSSSEQDDGYIPNGYPTTASSDVNKHDFDATLSQLITDHANDLDDADSSGPSKPKHCKWPQRPELLLKHVCAKCGMEFGKESFMEQHLDNLHSELHTAKNLKILITSATEGECQICGAIVQHRSVRDLQAHHFLHLQYKSYKCKCHSYHFQDKQAGLQHLNFHAEQTSMRKTQTFQEPESIPWVGSQILEDGTAYDPEFPETGVRFVCPECGINFPGEDEWKEHCNTSHDFKTMEGLNMTKLDTTQVRCNDCNTIIMSKADNYKLRRHKVTHSPFKAFHCKLCKYERKRKEDVLQHIRHSHVRRGVKYY